MQLHAPQQPQHHNQRRITSSLAASSEVVHALFGESVGPCWGDFSCTHLRIRGRLYATSQAILFYTNFVLGAFERRICLLLRDVVDMELFRQTSIRIHTMDDETYIFKTFNDREQVLHLLNGLKILADRKRGGVSQLHGIGSTGANRTRNDSDSRAATFRQSTLALAPPSPRATSTLASRAISAGTTLSPPSPSMNSTGSSSNDGGRASAFVTTTPETTSTSLGLPTLLSTSPILPNRRRAASDSIVRVINSSGDDNPSPPLQQRLAPKLLPREPLAPIESNEELNSLNSNQVETLTSSPPSLSGRISPSLILDQTEDEEEGDGANQQGQRPEVIWANIQQSKHQLNEVGMESLTLPCSLDEYHRLFLADNAQYPLDYYQKEYIKDTGVEITGWDIETTSSTFSNADVGDSDCCFHRTITFTHPIKNSMGIGPSSANTTRQQRLRRYPGIGLALENKTFVEGLPGADCFYIQDLWLLEPQKQPDGRNCEATTKLSVHFDVIFHKRSIFKNIIQKSVRKETKQWIAGYVDMVQSVLGDRNDPTDNASVVNTCGLARSLSDGRRSSSTNMENVGRNSLSTQEPTLSSSSSLVVSASPLDASVVALVEKVQMAYRIIAFLVVVLVLIVLVLGMQMKSMQSNIVDLRADLLLVLQRQTQQLTQTVDMDDISQEL